ncbi:MAG: dTMP kinase [Acidimicrobiales bacterium]
MARRGRFIALEGGEGTGKSTQAAALAGHLGAVLTREPGGTPIGARLRAVLLDPDLGRLNDRSEALLMAADRAQHVDEVIVPALAAGRDVVTDRFSGSTLAYQGFGRGMDVGHLRRLSEWAADGVEPDVVVLLVVPAEVAADRLRVRASDRLGGRVADRLENEHVSFHDRVRSGYQTLADDNPDRWVVVDGAGSVAEVAAQVWAVCVSRLAALGQPVADRRALHPPW